MKNKKVILGMLLTMMLVIIGAGTSVSAKIIGDDYQVYGIGLGWILIGLAIVMFLIAYGMFKQKAMKKVAVIGVCMILIGLALQFVTVTETTTPATGGISASNCPTFDVTGIPVTSGTGYITTATYDNETATFTIPLTVADSSDGNLSGHLTALNFTIDPVVPQGTLNTMLATINFGSDYLNKYGGEYVFAESSDKYDVLWNKPGGSSKYYSGSYDMSTSGTSWLRLEYTFENGTAGNWVSKLSKVGDTVTWYISFSNGCGWTKTVTCNAIVISYTA